jgi:hypothetical protein
MRLMSLANFGIVSRGTMACGGRATTQDGGTTPGDGGSGGDAAGRRHAL